MLNKTQLKILSYLIDNPEKLFGIRELAKEISTVYYLVQRNIHQLKVKKIINLQKAGKTSIIRLNSRVDWGFLIEAEKFKKEHFFQKYSSLQIMLNKIISNAQSGFFILLAFGSYAKNTPRKDSDLDLLIVVSDDKQAQAIERTVSTISRISPIMIHETIVTEKSFITMLQKKGLNVANEAKEKHILIYGGEIYYKLLNLNN